ncbi:MAG: hypothetical protein SVW02_00265 [Candidatus Nanohaloarchaea archaeon]|nr:hypothetical protein [Candidatus Nanohaloarchaea archaeon]
MDIDDFRASDDWVHSVGFPLSKIHFREVGGRGHAVCDFDTGECEVHEDSANPHHELRRHLVQDAPEIAAGLAITTASVLLWRKLKAPF